MSQIRNLTPAQETFLVKCWDVLNEWYVENKSNPPIFGSGPMYYNWDVYKEMQFISKVLNNSSYDLFYESDRLNSLSNLYRYLKVKI
jgi:hypothetical protein